MLTQRSATVFLLTFIALLFLCECINGGDVAGYPAAPNCARLECPYYEVVHSEKDYEIRVYSTFLWAASSPIVSKSLKKAADEGFLELFSFYQGNNDQNAKLNMTAPVVVELSFPSYYVLFLVPRKNQGSIPLPRAPGISQWLLPGHNRLAAVRRFDGYITDENVPIQLDALKKSLKGTPYERALTANGRVSVAGYNSPFELTNRVNEVMIWFAE